MKITSRVRAMVERCPELKPRQIAYCLLQEFPYSTLESIEVMAHKERKKMLSEGESSK